MKSKILNGLLSISKFIVFAGFIYGSWAMFKIGNNFVGALILLAVGVFMLFNKVDNIDKRLQRVEVKQNDRQM